MSQTPRLFAELLQLNGKYYGTEVCVSVGNGANDSMIIKFWKSGIRPSKRQLRYWENVIGIDTNDKEEIRDCMSDGHYESEIAYELAMEFLSLINTMPTDKSYRLVKMMVGE